MPFLGDILDFLFRKRFFFPFLCLTIKTHELDNEVIILWFFIGEILDFFLFGRVKFFGDVVTFFFSFRV